MLPAELRFVAGDMAYFRDVWYAGMEETNGHSNGAFDFERDIDSYIPVEVTETRLTGKSQWLSPTYLQHPSRVACTYSEALLMPAPNGTLRRRAHITWCSPLWLHRLG